MLSEILYKRHIARDPTLRQRQAPPVARPGEVEDSIRFEIGESLRRPADDRLRPEIRGASARDDIGQRSPV